MKLADHPTVREYRQAGAAPPSPPTLLEYEELRASCLAAGADDVGFVPIDHADIADQRADIERVFPHAKALISFVLRMNREPIRSPARSVANLEFHHTGDDVDEVARHIVGELERRGVRAINPSMGFPMEMSEFPGKIWVVSHKPVAVAAGLGRMGIHRNLIHPKLGNFVLLGTIVADTPVSRYDVPIDYNPCLECKLCVAACPVGAIGADGHFDFSACYTHNYREFMGGFTDWVEQVAESNSAVSYRARVSDSESASMWQSLSHGANYKAAYCMAVCPAGEDVIGPFLEDKARFKSDVVTPLQDKAETVYVLADSDAEAHVARRFAHKATKRVGNSLRPRSIGGFLRGMPMMFQRHRASGVHATYHFSFRGREQVAATVVIADEKLEVREGHHGEPDLRIDADAETWLGFLAKERSLPWALVRGRIRVRGRLRLLRIFARCFPR